MDLVKNTQRMGLLLPSSNTTQEPEFTRMLPANVTMHCGRLTLSTIDPDSTVKIVAELETEARKLADAQVDALVLSATAPSTRMGKGYDREVCDRIEQAAGKPATTAATAMLQAFEVLGIRRIALAAPWLPATNTQVADFIEANGVKVLTQEAMGYVRNSDVGLLPAQTAYEWGLQADRLEADAIFLACGNWLTLDIVHKLEQATGKPVLTTNNCAFWAVLRMLGGHRNVKGFGKLFEHHLQID
jgi:maleate cis-trans isomerase